MNRPTGAGRPGQEGFLGIAVMLGVVLMFVGLWLVLFMATFVGYLTIPFVLLFAFLVLWAFGEKAFKRWRRKSARESRTDAS